jgi:hypothetical protein
MNVRNCLWLAIPLGILTFVAPVSGQAPAQAEPVTFTREQDHQNMMQQLGITRLRPAPTANQAEPNAANYDESLANPYPLLPDPLRLENGAEVTSAETWWARRRPEIVELFDREIYGRLPENVPSVTWVVAETREVEVAGVAMSERRLEGRVDNAAYPAIEVMIQMTVATPRNTTSPVPVLLMFGRADFGGGATPPAPNPAAGPGKDEQLVAAGWGYAYVNPGSIQADNGAGLTRGIIGLVNRGQPRRPDDWGSLRAWAWGASRALDYLETMPQVDATRVGIEGVSRFGKAALVTMAYDQRFAAVLVGSSGEGGASLLRRNFGESVENLTAPNQYHWMAGNFLKYGTAESSFGQMTPGDLPVDSHQLLALAAPRPTFISYGIPERGDAHWLDHQGSYMAAVAAGPVFRLLGARDLGTSDDYSSERMPAVNVDMLDGQIGWRQHDGGHTSTPNIGHFASWANRIWAERSGSR